MNLLQVWIKEIYSEVDVTDEYKYAPYWHGEKMIRVTMLTDCWGNKETIVRQFTAEKWESIKKQGYFVE